MTRIAVAVLLVAALAAAAAPATARDGAAPPRPRVVLVTETTGDAGSVWQLTVAGLRRAAAQLDAKAEVVVPSVRETTYSVAVGLARAGADLVIGGLALRAPEVLRAARESPGTAFAVLDYGPGDVAGAWPPNAQGLVFREEEIGYLVGYLAGLVERERPGRDAVATIGGIKAPPVDRFIAGFRAGARRASPRIVTRNAYAGTFTDPERCARIAAAQVAAGAGVVFPVAGACGDGALAVARRLGAWGVGVDADQSALGPHILTSAVKRFDVAVHATVARLVAGTLRTGGVTSFGLREHGLALGAVSPRVPRRLVALARAIERDLAAGRIDVPTTVS